MAYEYRNRRGDTYLLQTSKMTRTGKTRYYFGRKLTGDPVQQVPEGYRVFESPESAQVYLRKEVPTRITPDEREIVAEGIRRLSNVAHFIVEVEGDALVAYLPSESNDEAFDILSEFAGPAILSSPRAGELRDRRLRRSRHEKAMRFELSDADRRLFTAARRAFRGSSEGWRYLAGPNSLSDLVDRFVGDLGEEGFYEL